jgi:glycine/D-amino acid oxidase-like deaminating enzyme
MTTERSDTPAAQLRADDAQTSSIKENISYAGDVIGEFASSAWRSGFQRPWQSVEQLFGKDVTPVQVDDNVHGWMKAANVAGNAVGQLIDLYTVGRLLGGGGAALGTDAMMARTLTINGTAGFINGALLTPVDPGANQFTSRLTRGGVDAGTFMALGAGTTATASKLGEGLSGLASNLGGGVLAKTAQVAAGVGDRAIVNAAGGVGAGLANTQLDAFAHGQWAANGQDYVNGAASWAFGNVLLGEGAHHLNPVLNKAVETGGKLVRTAVGKGEVSGGREPAERPAARTEQAAATDAVVASSERALPKLDLLGLKEIAQSGDEAKVRSLVNEYYPHLQKAFPLPGEIQSPETYVNYLMDPQFPWEMEQLRGADGKVQGGLQYQILPVGGDQVGKAGWLEHIWVDGNVRQGGYGSALLAHVQNQVQKKGGDVTFWEWNNPDKMSLDEIAEDAKGGITTQDRVDYWARRGGYVVVVKSTGEIAPYAQPGMDGQEEVPYLSLAWSKPGGLDGQTISKSDYLKTLLAAHSTITDVDADATVARYKAELEALPETEFQFVRLKDYIKQRTAALSETPSKANDTRIARWNGHDFVVTGPTFEIAPALPNGEVEKAMKFQRDTSGNSPWLRTIEGITPLPRLEGQVDADVAVVGSGVVGQQIAYRLGQMGKKVVVLEGGRVASGTSGMMGAMNTMVPDTGFGPMLEKLGPEKFSSMVQRMLAARGSVESLGRRYGDFRPDNSYNVAYSENNPDVAAEANLLRQFDPRVRFVNGKEAEDIFPLARSAAILPGEGNLNPVKMLNGMARSGLYQVFEHSPVLAVAPTTQGAYVFTDRGVVHAREKVILATNNPVKPFADANDHLTPVQTFANVADIGRHMPGNYFDAPDQSSGKVPFSYWRQFNLPLFGKNEALVGGTAHFLQSEPALPFEPQLPDVTGRLFNGASGRNQFTALIWTDYDWGLPLYYRHPQFPAISTALGGGGNGLNAGAMLAEAAAREAVGKDDPLLSPARGMH